MRILLIEDNQDLAANICEFLKSSGHVMDHAGDGVTGLHLAVVNDYDAVVLDLMLPGMDGLQLCRKLRQDSHKSMPVLMLTARDTVDDKLAGFEAGADDYLVKPFSLLELDARLQALARRARPAGSSLLQVADLVLDLDCLEARRGTRPVGLTPIGTRILKLLMQKSPRVVTRQAIEAEVWGDDPPDSDALRAHIFTLRQAIDRDETIKLLHTVHGVGYRLVERDAAKP